MERGIFSGFLKVNRTRLFILGIGNRLLLAEYLVYLCGEVSCAFLRGLEV